MGGRHPADAQVPEPLLDDLGLRPPLPPAGADSFHEHAREGQDHLRQRSPRPLDGTVHQGGPGAGSPRGRARQVPLRERRQGVLRGDSHERDGHDRATLVRRARGARAPAWPPASPRPRRCAASRTRPSPTSRRPGSSACSSPRAGAGPRSIPRAFFDVQATIAAACPSTAWVLGVVGVHDWQLALFPEEAQKDVWGEDSSTLISSSYAPTGKVTRVDGGFRVSGRWSFSSGCDHCRWVFLGGMVPPEAEGKPPEMRTFLLPREGLPDRRHLARRRPQGDGQQGHRGRGRLRPRAPHPPAGRRLQAQEPGQRGQHGAALPAPLRAGLRPLRLDERHRHPQGALDAYRAVAAKRVAAGDGSKVAEEAAAQLVCACAAAALDEVRLVLYRNMDELMARARAGRGHARSSAASASASTRRTPSSKCVAAVDELFAQSGGRAIFLNSPMLRYFLDAHAARAHYANNPDKPGRNFGGVLLGLKNVDYLPLEGAELDDRAARISRLRGERPPRVGGVRHRRARPRDGEPGGVGRALAADRRPRAPLLRRRRARPTISRSSAGRSTTRRRSSRRSRSCAPPASTSTLGTAEDAARRHVRALARFRDPGGVPPEIFHGPEMAPEPFRSDAGAIGLRRRRRAASATWSCRDREPGRDARVLLRRPRLPPERSHRGRDPRLSRRHALPPRQPAAPLRRLRRPAGQDPAPLHARGGARWTTWASPSTARSAPASRIMHTLGRHPNDRMFSFYARTPSGFQFEVGWGGARGRRRHVGAQRLRSHQRVGAPSPRSSSRRHGRARRRSREERARER